MTTALAEPTWSYNEAAVVFRKDRKTVATHARRLGLGPPLGGDGMLRLAGVFGVRLSIAVPPDCHSVAPAKN